MSVACERGTRCTRVQSARELRAARVCIARCVGLHRVLGQCMLHRCVLHAGWVHFVCCVGPCCTLHGCALHAASVHAAHVRIAHFMCAYCTLGGCVLHAAQVCIAHCVDVHRALHQCTLHGCILHAGGLHSARCVDVLCQRTLHGCTPHTSWLHVAHGVGAYRNPDRCMLHCCVLRAPRVHAACWLGARRPLQGCMHAAPCSPLHAQGSAPHACRRIWMLWSSAAALGVWQLRASWPRWANVCWCWSSTTRPGAAATPSRRGVLSSMWVRSSARWRCVQCAVVRAVCIALAVQSVHAVRVTLAWAVCVWCMQCLHVGCVRGACSVCTWGVCMVHAACKNA